MFVSRAHMRLLFGFAAVVLLSAALTFIAFASSFPGEDISSDEGYFVDVAVLQRPGVLTVMKGGVKVNGHQATTGRTILTSDKIVTDPDGIAQVDLGPRGRLTIREGTTVTLVFMHESVHVKSECAHTRIEVFSGQVDVETPRKEILTAGAAKRYGGSVQATSRVAVFEIRCLTGRLGAFGRRAAGILATELLGEEPPAAISPVLP
jgi:hypothetical protein